MTTTNKTVWASASQPMGETTIRYPVMFHLTAGKYGEVFCGYDAWASVTLPLVLLDTDGAFVKVCGNCRKHMARLLAAQEIKP